MGSIIPILTCSQKVNGTSHPSASPWPWPSQHRHPLPPAQPGSAGVGQTGLSQQLPSLSRPLLLGRAAALATWPELHAQHSPKLLQQRNELPRPRGSRAGTQILSSCLSHEGALWPGSPLHREGDCGTLWGGLACFRRLGAFPLPALTLIVPQASQKQLPLPPRKGKWAEGTQRVHLEKYQRGNGWRMHQHQGKGCSSSKTPATSYAVGHPGSLPHNP